MLPCHTVMAPTTKAQMPKKIFVMTSLLDEVPGELGADGSERLVARLDIKAE